MELLMLTLMISVVTIGFADADWEFPQWTSWQLVQKI